MKKLSVIIPFFNEEKTINKLLNNLVKVKLIENIQTQIILINDCSKDKTEAVVKNFIKLHPNEEIQYFKHNKNRGKGAAIKTGIEKATGNYIVIQDADLEYDPEEYNLLLKPIVKKKADVVYGSRFMGANLHRVLFFWHTIGNKFLTFLSNLFTDLNLTDVETCYKMFRTKILKSIQLKENRFGFEPEVTSKIAQIPNIRIYEVGISYYGRTYEEGKKIQWKDGFRAIYCILKYNLFNK